MSNSNSAGPKKSFKIVVLGAVSVGKTSLSIQYVDKHFVAQSKATIAAAFHTKSLNLNGVRVDLQIWDTAGQEKFRSLTPMYYRECAAALIVYDLTKPETLETAQYWIKELRERENPYCMLLIGNKADAVPDLTAACAQGRAYAEAEKLTFFAASAKTGDGVNDLFNHLISKLPIEGAGSSSGAGGAPANKPAVVTVSAAVPKQQQAGGDSCGC